LKRTHAVVKISEDFHKRLGRPNMEKYGEELVKRIKEKIREEEKGDSK
jgi:predicted transcriptional regulator